MRNTSPLVRWEKYSPFSLGLEDTFRTLDKIADAGTNYPVYNIVKLNETEQRLDIALAGYDRDDVEVSVERNVLTVSVQKETTVEENYLHRGIAKRNFTKSWQLGENTLVGTPSLVNGILSISVSLNIPEELKRKVLPIS